MLRWISNLGLRGRLRKKAREAEYIFRHVELILIRETTGSLYLYGEAMHALLTEKASRQGIPVSRMISLDGLPLAAVLNIEIDPDDTSLLDLRRIDDRQSAAEIRGRVRDHCGAILNMHYSVAIRRRILGDRHTPELDACGKLYTGLVTELYLLGAGETSAEDFCIRLRANL